MGFFAKCSGLFRVFTEILDWILKILLTFRISLRINGQLTGYFECSKGVRQGDPLSPLLFYLTKKYLSHSISKSVTDGAFVPMCYTQNLVFPSHLLYADDVVIFGTATKRNFQSLKCLFDD